MFVGASLVVEAAEEAAGANGEGGEKDDCSSNRLLLSGVSPEKNGDVGSNTNELECSPFVALWAAVTAWPVMLLPSFPHVWFVTPLSTNAPMTKDAPSGAATIICAGENCILAAFNWQHITSACAQSESGPWGNTHPFFRCLTRFQRTRCLTN